MDDNPKYYDQARNKATQRYQAAHMDQLRIWTYRADRVKDRVKIAAARTGAQSPADYMRRAILSRLDADGVTLDTIDN